MCPRETDWEAGDVTGGKQWHPVVWGQQSQFFWLHGREPWAWGHGTSCRGPAVTRAASGACGHPHGCVAANPAPDWAPGLHQPRQDVWRVHLPGDSSPAAPAPDTGIGAVG